MTDFAAIDFETANEQMSGVCSVGVVIVRGVEVVDRFYRRVHGNPRQRALEHVQGQVGWRCEFHLPPGAASRVISAERKAKTASDGPDTATKEKMTTSFWRLPFYWSGKRDSNALYYIIINQSFTKEKE